MEDGVSITYAADNGPCYYDGEECTCDAVHSGGDCPRDEYVHDDLMDEDAIDDYYMQNRRSYDEEETSYRL